MTAAPLAAPCAPQIAEVSDLPLPVQRRMAIDLITTTRARMIRVQLLSTQLLRPDPTAPEGTEERELLLPEVAEVIAEQERAVALLLGLPAAGTTQFDQSIRDWIRDHAREEPDAVAEFQGMLELAQNLGDALEKAPDMAPTLSSILSFGRKDFFQTVTGFCERLWADLDSARDVQMEHIAAASSTMEETLDRLAWIGRHVRLVAINASVEAARAGEAGKGLGIIAVEFKALAEEVQTLVVNARDSIDGLSMQEIRPGS